MRASSSSFSLLVPDRPWLLCYSSFLLGSAREFIGSGTEEKPTDFSKRCKLGMSSIQS